VDFFKSGKAVGAYYQTCISRAAQWRKGQRGRIDDVGKGVGTIARLPYTNDWNNDLSAACGNGTFDCERTIGVAIRCREQRTRAGASIIPENLYCLAGPKCVAGERHA